MQLLKKTVMLITGLWFFGMFISCKSSNPVNPKVPVKTQLEGTWTGTNMNGTDQTLYTYKMAVDSIFVSADSNEMYHGTFTLDTVALPAQITILITKSDSASYVGKTIPAIYVLSGNVLEITANNPGSSRPTSFDSGEILKLFLQE